MIWNATAIAELAGRPIVLKFRLQDCKRYSCTRCSLPILQSSTGSYNLFLMTARCCMSGAEGGSDSGRQNDTRVKRRAGGRGASG
jgi:hypothetical protein